MRGSIFGLPVIAALLLATHALAIDITTGSETVPPGQVGVLPADLVCAPPSTILLENNARLELNGHVLDGCHVRATGFDTESRKITVRGPGEIRNASVILNNGLLRISDVVIVDAVGDGIRGGTDSKIRADNVTVTGSEGHGIYATKVDARDVTSTDNGTGGLGVGIRGHGGVSGRNLVVSGNDEGVSSSAGKTTIRYSEVTGNEGIGVIAFKLTVIGSTLTGNNPSAAPFAADLVSAVAPKVKTTTCGTSLQSNGGETPWGVCSDD
jgi:hypothetical protein